MKGVLACILLLITASAQATQRITILSDDSVWMGRAKELGELLGSNCSVGFREIESPFQKSHTDILVIDFSILFDKSWKDSLDSFVPKCKEIISQTKSMLHPRTTYILLPALGANADEECKTYEIPLIAQIAHESSCPVVDMNDPAFIRRDPSGLTKLFVSLAPFSRNPGTWHVVSATSEQSDEGPAKNAIDNNPDTYWHTRYDPNPTKVPHEIIIDLVKTQTINGFSYLARQDGGVNGRVKDFEIYVSDYPNKWQTPALKGTLRNTMDEQRLLFDHPATGRYLKFVALSEVNGNIWTSIAELGILPSGNSK